MPRFLVDLGNKGPTFAQLVRFPGTDPFHSSLKKVDSRLMFTVGIHHFVEWLNMDGIFFSTEWAYQACDLITARFFNFLTVFHMARDSGDLGSYSACKRGRNKIFISRSSANKSIR